MVRERGGIHVVRNVGDITDAQEYPRIVVP